MMALDVSIRLLGTVAMLKILHTADWQIGKNFGAFEPDDATLLTEARIRTVARVAEIAREHAVDLVTVGGDAFDRVSVNAKTLRRTFAATEGHPVPWAFISGNHDPALQESNWSCARRIDAVPAHVRLCLKPEVVMLLDGRVALLPAPLTQRTSYADPTEWFDAAETPAGALRIGLAHGAVSGYLPDSVHSNNPIAADRAARARLDALLLGDWHGFLALPDGRTVYSGTPETDRFVNNRSGHVALLEFDGNGPPRITAIPTGQYRWQVLEPLLTIPTDVDEAIADLEALQGGDVVQFRPRGRVTLGDNRRLCQAGDRARARTQAFQSQFDELHIIADDADIDALKADGFVSSAIERLRAEERSGSAEQADIARESLVLLANLIDNRGAEALAQCD